MIDIINKEECVGCNGCVQICPKNCITMPEDEQGFKYPRVDIEKCINCNLCEKVCPVINQAAPEDPVDAYAAKNINIDIMNASSSGGVFYALAEKVINDGGVVFGARFNNNWEAVHDNAETLNGIKEFLRSKYVQSNIGDSFIKARGFLDKGRKVLFSGTPCQIAGLKRFLKNDYKELLVTVDIACHGVPSPKIWHDYLEEMASSKGLSLDSICYINFRDKRYGWDKYGMNLTFNNKGQTEEYFSPVVENLYMQGFLKDLYLRPSCYACPAKCGKSGADITLSDFWGVNNYAPELYKKGYYSLVLSKTEKGNTMLNNLNKLNIEKVSYEQVVKWNTALINSPKYPYIYKDFWIKYSALGITGLKEVIKGMQPSKLECIKMKIKFFLNSISYRK